MGSVTGMEDSMVGCPHQTERVDLGIYSHLGQAGHLKHPGDALGGEHICCPFARA